MGRIRAATGSGFQEDAQLAKKSALNARAREGALTIVDALEYEKPKTKDLVDVAQETRCKRQEGAAPHGQ